MPSKRTTECIIILALITLSSALILSHLGNVYLWGDEAQTAMVAKTVLKYGYPRGFDGVNYICQLKGAQVGRNFVWIWHPWFPFYLLAGFFAAFGQSTFTARLPFALMGIATVILTYYFAKSLWNNRRAGIISAVLLMTCVPFLLMVRQCRYYAPMMLFSVAGLYAYTRMLDRRKHSAAAFVISGVLLFHTHFVYCGVLLATVFIHSLIFRRDRVWAVMVMSAIIAALGVPWMIWASSMGNIAQGYGSIVERHALQFAGVFTIQVMKHVFPPWLLALPIGVYLLNRHRKRKISTDNREGLALLILFALMTLAAAAFTAQYPYFRYIATLVPAVMIITGLILESGMKIHPAVGIVFIALLAYFGRMPSYLYEITHDYDGPNEGIVRYFQAHAKKGDIVVTNHEDLPIKFYTGLRVICGATGEDLSDVKKADWVVMRHDMVALDMQSMPYLVKHIPWDNFEEITLDYPDIIFENREDPENHLFRSAQDVDPVIIYHRIPD